MDDDCDGQLEWLYEIRDVTDIEFAANEDGTTYLIDNADNAFGLPHLSLLGVGGELIWHTDLPGEPTYLSAVQSYTGGVVVSGQVQSSTGNAYVSRLDAAGIVIWEKIFSWGNRNEGATQLVIGAQGDIYAGVYSTSTATAEDTDIVILKLSTEGAVLSRGGYENVRDMSLSAMIGAAGGGVWALVMMPEDDSGFATNLLRFDSDLSFVSGRIYDFGPGEYMTTLFEAADGTMTLGGTRTSLSGTEQEGLVVHLDRNGEVVWESGVSQPLNDYTVYSILPNGDGGYVALGNHGETVDPTPPPSHTYPPVYYTLMPWLIWLDADGVPLEQSTWDRCPGGRWCDAHQLGGTADSGLMIRIWDQYYVDTTVGYQIKGMLWKSDAEGNWPE